MSEGVRFLVRAWPFWGAAGALLAVQLMKMIASGELTLSLDFDDNAADRAEICLSNCRTAGYEEDSEEFWACVERCVEGY